MGKIYQLPQRGFLLLGIALILVSVGLYIILAEMFLFYLYFIPSVLLIYYYFISSLTLDEKGVAKRTLLLIKKYIKWHDSRFFVEHE